MDNFKSFLKNKKILITGASGVIGYNLCQKVVDYSVFKIHINSLSDNYHKTYSNKVINYHNDMERYTHHYNNYIYVPNTIEKDDLIVIHKPNNSGDYPLTPYRSHTSGNTIILA